MVRSRHPRKREKRQSKAKAKAKARSTFQINPSSAAMDIETEHEEDGYVSESEWTSDEPESELSGMEEGEIAMTHWTGRHKVDLEQLVKANAWESQANLFTHAHRMIRME